jgi:RNA polymerase primary sigma factor
MSNDELPNTDNENAQENVLVPYFYKNDDLIKSIMNDASKYPPLSREAERELFVEYSNKDLPEKRKDVIKTKLVNHNMRFVLQYSFNYRNFPNHLADIIAAARTGILIAIDLFEYKREMKFISFAVWYIKSQVSKFLEGDDLIRLPSHQKVKLNRAKKTKKIEDFSDEVRELYEVTQPYISYDAPVSNDSDLKLLEIIPDRSQVNMESREIKIKAYSTIREKLKEKLTKDENIAITHLFGLETGEELGLREVGDIMKKSHERVRQLKNSALDKLRKSKEVEDLASLFTNNI